jgi:hypothetical protein
MIIFVRSGAASEAAITRILTSGCYASLRAIKVVKGYLLPTLPLETAQRIRKLERALDKQKLDEV